MSRLCRLGPFCDRYNRRTGFPGETGGFNLCETCAVHAVSDIAALLYDFVDLSQIVARHAARSEAKISRPKPESVPPLDMSVVALRDDIEGVLCRAEQELRRLHRLPLRTPRNARPGYNVDQALAIVLPRLEVLAGLEPLPPDAWPPTTGAEMVSVLRQLHRRAHALLGRKDLTVALPGACPACHAMKTLSRRDGSDTVLCGSCGHAMTWDAYRKSVTLVVTEVVPIPTRLTRNQQA